MNPANLSPRVLASLLGLVAVAFFAWQVVEQMKLSDASHRVAVARDLGVVRARLEHALSGRLALVDGVAALIAVDPELTVDRFERYAAAATSRGARVRSLQLARGAVVTHVYPVDGNQAALGHDLLADPARRESVERTIRNKEFVLSGPVELRQGGTAVIGRLPIFLGEDPETFWGLATVVIDLDHLLDEAAAINREDKLEIALRGRDGTGGAGPLFHGSEALVSDNPVTDDVRFKGGYWQLLARPAGGWSAHLLGGFLPQAMGLQLGLLAALLCALFMLVRRAEAEPGRLRRSIREARSQLQMALDTITEGFACYDADDRLVLFNRRYREFYQDSAPVIVEGTRFADVIRYGAVRGQYPEADGDVEGFIERRIQQHRHPQGTILQQLRSGRWIQISERRTPDGGIAGIRTDVTELKRIEDELRNMNETLEERVRERVAELDRVAEELRAEVESNALLAAVVNAIPNGVTISDPRQPDNPLIYCNPSFTHITGYTLDDIRGRNCRFLTGRGSEPAVRRQLREGIAAAAPVHVEIMNYRKDGSEFWNDLSVFPVGNAEGEVTHFVGVQVDASERREAAGERENMQRRLMEAGKFEALGTLAGGIAHEINTPVQYLSDNLGFLKTAFAELGSVLELLRGAAASDDPSGQSEVLADIRRRLEEIDYEFLAEEIPSATEQSLEGVERIAQIVRAVRDFSHPSERQQTEVDLNAVVRTAVTVTRNQWKYHAEVVTDLSTDPPVIQGSPGELQQVLVNLIVNAAQAIEDQKRSTPGTIVITTRGHDRHAEIEVGDDGPGIPESIRSRIFEPFFTTKEPGRGTGQGLAISDSIVRSHGGEMVVRSAVGAGTTFTLRFDEKVPDKAVEKADG